MLDHPVANASSVQNASSIFWVWTKRSLDGGTSWLGTNTDTIESIPQSFPLFCIGTPANHAKHKHKEYSSGNVRYGFPLFPRITKSGNGGIGKDEERRAGRYLHMQLCESSWQFCSVSALRFRPWSSMIPRILGQKKLFESRHLERAPNIPRPMDCCALSDATQCHWRVCPLQSGP